MNSVEFGIDRRDDRTRTDGFGLDIHCGAAEFVRRARSIIRCHRRGAGHLLDMGGLQAGRRATASRGGLSCAAGDQHQI